MTLERLAHVSGVSRAMISRIERAESSATAALLAKLCNGLGISLSELMADAERAAGTLARRENQLVWRDPQTGYLRRLVSPPVDDAELELTEIELPAGARASFDPPPRSVYEQQLYVIEGILRVEIGERVVDVRPGDCMHVLVDRGTAYENCTKQPVRYLIARVKTWRRRGK